MERDSLMAAPTRLQWQCAVMAAAVMGAGVVGMMMGFLFLASADAADNRAGLASFVTGGVLVAAGLLSLALVSTRPALRAELGPPFGGREV